MSEQKRSDTAVQLKKSGYNCCQAVLCAFAEDTGYTEEQMKQIGASFCAGMGGMEGTCGALIGAEVLLGMHTYQGKPILRDAARLHSAFIERCGASVCKDLKGIGTGRVLCPCEECVRNAARLAEEMIF